MLHTDKVRDMIIKFKGKCRRKAFAMAIEILTEYSDDRSGKIIDELLLDKKHILAEDSCEDCRQ